MKPLIGPVLLAVSASLPSMAAAEESAAAARARSEAAAGLAAAADFPGYASLCDLDARIRNVNLPRDPRVSRDGATRRGGAARPRPEPLPPIQVFDNLYFLGTQSVAAWLHGTEEGYLLIDGLNTDGQAQSYILDGMVELGLDPAAIKGILVSHGHGDHYGGADHVAKTLGLDIMMSAPDWDLVARLGTHPRFGPPPEKGRVVSDGEVLHYGASQMTLHVTPGHTPGTVSPIFEVFDHGERHVAMLWGGTGFNFGPDVAIFATYADSAARMADLAEAAGVDVFLSGHPRRDNALENLAALAAREVGAPHPFVMGAPGHALFEVLQHCALAQAARFEAAEQ